MVRALPETEFGPCKTGFGDPGWGRLGQRGLFYSGAKDWPLQRGKRYIVPCSGPHSGLRPPEDKGQSGEVEMVLLRSLVREDLSESAVGNGMWLDPGHNTSGSHRSSF